MERPWTFQTRQLGDPERVVRTFGVLLDASGRPRGLVSRDALACAEPVPPPDCAHGKVVVLSRDARGGRVVCYQRGQGASEPAVVACCNGTAAAAAHYAAAVEQSDVSLRLRLSGQHVVRATARVAGAAEAPAVAQSWHHVPFAVAREERVGGRQCALCAGALNHYLIVRLRQGETPSDVTSEESRELGRRFGLDAEPLLARVAVVGCAEGAPPSVKVFTCGEREHPSAPPTGLAALALAAQRVGWLPLAPLAFVRTPAGAMRLPRAQWLADGTARVDFAPLLVQLERTAAAALAVAL